MITNTLRQNQLISKIKKLNLHDQYFNDTNTHADNSYDLAVWYLNKSIVFITNIKADTTPEKVSNFLHYHGDLVILLSDVQKFLVAERKISATNTDIDKFADNVKMDRYDDVNRMLYDSNVIGSYDKKSLTALITAGVSYYQQLENKINKNVATYNAPIVTFSELNNIKKLIEMLQAEKVIQNVPSNITLLVRIIEKVHMKDLIKSPNFWKIPLIPTYVDEISIALAENNINPLIESKTNFISTVVKEYNRVCTDIFDIEGAINKNTIEYHSILKRWLDKEGHLYEITDSQATEPKERFDLGEQIKQWEKTKDEFTSMITDKKTDEPQKLMTKTIVINKSDLDKNLSVQIKDGKIPKNAVVYGLNDNDDVIFISFRYPYTKSKEFFEIYDELKLAFVKNGTGKPTIDDKEFPIGSIIGTTSVKKGSNISVPGASKNQNFYNFYTIYGTINIK